ncbi:MAG: hypothetical protein PHW00_00960 [Clostridia bacterium]|nr:hypothetical protein [Clostridia bacterium]
MKGFASYYLEFFITFFNNIWKFITTRLGSWGTIFSGDIPSYFRSLSMSSASFNFWDWVAYVFVTLINLALVFFICYRLVQLIRRYIIYRGNSVNKDKLLEELAIAKMQITELNKEKIRLYELQLGTKVTGPPPTEDSEEEVEEYAGRFAKLAQIDQQYAEGNYVTTMSDADKVTLAELVERFRNFTASQLHLYYSPYHARCYFAGMATTKLLILEGISGTGKTSFPYAMSKFFKNNASIVSVQPSWRDKADLLGYFNEFTKQFNESDFLSSVYEANYRDEPRFVILDEMNLARIEYYFAEFLSVMEMPDVTEWNIEVVSRSFPDDPILLEEGKLRVPQNIWFVGTANQDDSTFAITDKVYDRAISIDINKRGEYFDAPLTEPINCTYDYLDRLFFDAVNDYRISDSGRKAIDEVEEYITEKLRVSFGNRIKRQLDRYIPVFVACGGTEIEALDFVLMSKIFRKFTMLNIPFLTKELNGLIALLDRLFGKNVMQYSIEYIKELIKTA